MRSGNLTITTVLALVTVLGALVAAETLYGANQRTWQSVITIWRGAIGPPAETRSATEDWPICTTMALIGSEAEWAQLDPDFAAGKKALAAEDWNGAITILKLAALRDPRNADIQNYIGYAYRRMRELGPAMGHYQQALMFNPRHRSAHEHLGELFLALREPAKAEEHLAALEQICLVPCEESGDLKRAITAYRSAVAVKAEKAGTTLSEINAILED